MRQEYILVYRSLKKRICYVIANICVGTMYFQYWKEFCPCAFAQNSMKNVFFQCPIPSLVGPFFVKIRSEIKCHFSKMMSNKVHTYFRDVRGIILFLNFSLWKKWFLFAEKTLKKIIDWINWNSSKARILKPKIKIHILKYQCYNL